MKTRASITAKGEVQKVGYRDVVQKIAQDMGVKGFVENLRDGNVLVVAEGEKETVEEFIKKIKVKKDFIDVKDISIDYEKATGEFEYFDIKYGRLEEEFGERVGAAIQYLKAVDSNVEGVGSKVEAVGSSINMFRNETKKSFVNLRSDYGKISGDITTAIQGIERVAENERENLL